MVEFELTALCVNDEYYYRVFFFRYYYLLRLHNSAIGTHTNFHCVATYLIV